MYPFSVRVSVTIGVFIENFSIMVASTTIVFSLFSPTFVVLILMTTRVREGRSKFTEPEIYRDEEANGEEESKMMRREEMKWMKGHHRPKGRVVGGISANSWHTQYQVTLQTKVDGAHFCGGTIYNQDTIISAAHCFFHDQNIQLKASEISVVAGEYDLTAHENWEQRRDVSSITLFPGYRLYPGYNDVAILKLSAPLRFNIRVHSIRIADEEEEPQGRGRVSGWGYALVHEEHESQVREGYPETLMKADLVLIDKETCIRKHQNYALEHAKHKRIICAGAPNGRKGMDSCQGDSGGPLVCLDNRGQDYLCGIVQAGFGCGTALPGFYTKVSAVRNFIIKNGGGQSRGNLPGGTHEPREY